MPDPADREAVIVNGEPRPDAGRTVAELVAALGVRGGRGIAVAVDGEVVPRGGWEQRTLRAGERVEVLGAIQGG
ncbi:sulfur carrier protein ThiS [Patulibacter defluvii]|uniref:sulfur carrier protein ThiS n=1 Tax=Patulibacter defluvii TaxID=3095358 RepID=UPI002A763DF3|nr:sulfur carrier protein ThiS [Patulibacter sp. DM4]